ncbi:MAG: hypothetical protein AB7F40_00565 [Victivallaceae bacterium]|nr:hypothetical protein [Victivallaceae bacterium]
MKYAFFTCFNRDYMVTGLTLYRSLKALGMDFTLLVCALDAETYDVLCELKASGESLEPFRLEDLESTEPALADCKKARNFAEYIFTLSPLMPSYIFAAHPELDVIIYLDADLFFFKEPSELMREFEQSGGAVMIMEHGFTPKQEWRMEFGRFNVEFQVYRRGASDEILAWWRGKCLEWCFDRLENGRFADQKYLDEWPERFHGVAIARDPRAGIAPWNWPLRPVEEPVFYHFQGFRWLSRHFISHNLGSYGQVMPPHLLEKYYRRYAYEQLATRDWLRGRFPKSGFDPWKGRRRDGFGVLRGIASALRHRNLMAVK